jgi:hypothetical protein
VAITSRAYIPSKDNLLSRGLLHQPGGAICDWCCEASESSLHLFLHCKVAMVLWYEIFKWLGVVIVMPHNLFILFDCVYEAAKSKKSRKGFILVWHTTIWSLWLAHF